MCIVGQDFCNCGHYRRKAIFECFSLRIGQPCKGIKFNGLYIIPAEDCLMCQALAESESATKEVAATRAHADELALTAQAARFETHKASVALRAAQDDAQHQAANCQVCEARKELELCEARHEEAKHRAEVAEKVAGCEDLKGKIVLGQIETIRDIMASKRETFQAEYEEMVRGRLDFDAEKVNKEMAKVEAEAMRLKAD